MPYLIDLSTIFVLADVKSTDIPFIQAGLAAKAILPAYPGRVWQGNVCGSFAAI
jgi:multidrug resistance efflux pump